MTHRRIGFILLYEPSWFAEFMSAVGVFLWAVIALSSDDYSITGWQWIMPCAGLMFGPFRAYLLFHLSALPRVASASGGFVWWGWICYAVLERFGVATSLAAYLALAIGDALTVGKFSLQVVWQRKLARDHG